LAYIKLQCKCLTLSDVEKGNDTMLTRLTPVATLIMTLTRCASARHSKFLWWLLNLTGVPRFSYKPARGRPHPDLKEFRAENQRNEMSWHGNEAEKTFCRLLQLLKSDTAKDRSRSYKGCLCHGRSSKVHGPGCFSFGGTCLIVLRQNRVVLFCNNQKQKNEQHCKGRSHSDR